MNIKKKQKLVGPRGVIRDAAFHGIACIAKTTKLNAFDNADLSATRGKE